MRHTFTSAVLLLTFAAQADCFSHLALRPLQQRRIARCQRTSFATMQGEERGTESKMVCKGVEKGGVLASVMNRRAAILTSSSVLGILFCSSAVGADEFEETSAVAKMRARRNAAKKQVEEVPSALTAPAAKNEEETFDMDNLKEVLENASKATAAAASVAKKFAETAMPVLQDAATVTYKVGKGTVEVVVPAAKELSKTAVPAVKDAAKTVAETATPVLKDVAETASPLVQQGVSKAAPYLQQAVDQVERSEAFNSAAEALGGGLRGTTDAIDKVVNDPTLKTTVSTTQAVISETSRAVKPYVPKVAEGVATGAKTVAGALSWTADMINTFSTEGGEAAKEQFTDTIKSGVKSGVEGGVKFTQEVVVPAARDVALPAAKRGLNFAIENGGKALGEATKAALETPNGQALSQRMTEASQATQDWSANKINQATGVLGNR
jgi:hypothetical protein